MALFFIVINSRVEERYLHDPLSSPREIYDFLAFQEREVAEQRLISELDINTSSLQVTVLRRSHLIKADIPDSMLNRSSGDRWINDRVKHLVREAGIKSYLVPEAALQIYLGEDIVQTLSRLQKDLKSEVPDFSKLVIGSLELGGNVSRALSRQVVSVIDGADLLDIAHTIGEEAWNNKIPNIMGRIEKLLNPE